MIKQMSRREENMVLLNEWLKSYKKLKDLSDEMFYHKTYGITSPLWKTVWYLFERKTDLLERCITGKRGKWLFWYIYTNEMGKIGCLAKTGNMKKRIRIKNLTDLCKLLESNKC